MRKKTLKEYGYPAEGIIMIDDGGGDCHEAPQEIMSASTCGSCSKFNGEACTKEWNNADESYYIPDRDDKDPDTDTCDDIDYEPEYLDSEYGYRDPVRHEYSSDKTYQQACKAIAKINHDIRVEDEMWFNKEHGWCE